MMDGLRGIGEDTDVIDYEREVARVLGDYSPRAEAPATSTQEPCKLLRFPLERTTRPTVTHNDSLVITFPLDQQNSQAVSRQRLRCEQAWWAKWVNAGAGL
jgi:hypothetical protein